MGKDSLEQRVKQAWYIWSLHKHTSLDGDPEAATEQEKQLNKSTYHFQSANIESQCEFRQGIHAAEFQLKRHAQVN